LKKGKVAKKAQPAGNRAPNGNGGGDGDYKEKGKTKITESKEQVPSGNLSRRKRKDILSKKRWRSSESSVTWRSVLSEKEKRKRKTKDDPTNKKNQDWGDGS